jgi:hypothetical protein
LKGAGLVIRNACADYQDRCLRKRNVIETQEHKDDFKEWCVAVEHSDQSLGPPKRNLAALI